MVAAVRTEADTAGARLARARERAGLSVDQVADHLKLDPYTVVALEEGNYRSIGAAVFVRGFLRRYAALVGESPSEIEALYASQPDAEGRPDLSKTGMHRIEPDAFRPSLGVWPALIAALVLAVAGAAWWAMWSKPRASTPASTASPATAAPTGAAATAVQPSAPAGATAPGTEAAAKSASMSGRRVLQLIFSGECWAEIYDARGVRLYFGFGHAGTTQELSGVAPFRLTLANAGAVTVAMQGAAISLPTSIPGQRMHIQLDANGTVAPIP
jgi:cytoskeleton protein RodZ